MEALLALMAMLFIFLSIKNAIELKNNGFHIRPKLFGSSDHFKKNKAASAFFILWMPLKVDFFSHSTALID